MFQLLKSELLPVTDLSNMNSGSFSSRTLMTEVCKRERKKISMCSRYNVYICTQQEVSLCTRCYLQHLNPQQHAEQTFLE